MAGTAPPYDADEVPEEAEDGAERDLRTDMFYAENKVEVRKWR